ncbi:MAG: GGDEF domain-containing protein, partial [Firmicutes bacterium]|nr:GGDEF domain-containing protein [Bacillota bacterium]
AGDEVIKELGRRVSTSVRSDDTVGRLSGDEFTVLLPYINARLDVEEVVNRIIQSMNRPWRIMGNNITLTVSIGVAIYPIDGLDTKALIQHADRALYDAKEHGKNTYIFYGSRSK